MNVFVIFNTVMDEIFKSGNVKNKPCCITLFIVVYDMKSAVSWSLSPTYM